MKFHVEIIELNYGSVEVSARNKQEADEKARREYDKGNIQWNKHLIGSVFPEMIKDRGDER